MYIGFMANQLRGELKIDHFVKIFFVQNKVENCEFLQSLRNSGKRVNGGVRES